MSAKIQPESIAAGMQIRVVRELRKPYGSMVESRTVWEGVVTGLRETGRGASLVELDAGIDPISLQDYDNWAVTVEAGEWPEGTLVVADVEFSQIGDWEVSEPLKDAIFMRAPEGWLHLAPRGLRGLFADDQEGVEIKNLRKIEVPR